MLEGRAVPSWAPEERLPEAPALRTGIGGGTLASRPTSQLGLMKTTLSQNRSGCLLYAVFVTWYYLPFDVLLAFCTWPTFLKSLIFFGPSF